MDENLYWRAKSLPGAEYDSDRKTVAVPPVYFAEVVGFADAHDFQFTAKANELEAEARASYARVIMPEIPQPTIQKKKKRNDKL